MRDYEGSVMTAPADDPDEVAAVVDWEVSTYKCEECGKIIGAPTGLRVPRCCDHDMRRIR
jgi:hypothetical protein